MMCYHALISMAYTDDTGDRTKLENLHTRSYLGHECFVWYIIMAM